jgi:hypothetical protein
MERLLAAGHRVFFTPSILCLVCSIAYFAWHQVWDATGLLIGILIVGPFCLSMFLLPANLVSSAILWTSKKGWRLTTYCVLLISLVLTNGCCAVATFAIFYSVILKCAQTSHAWALVAGFGAATFPGCWIAFREREMLGGLLLAFFSGLASCAMICALLVAPLLMIPALLCVYAVAIVVNVCLTAPKVVPRKPKSAFDLAIFAMYGNPPPPNTADHVQAASLAAEFLGGVVSNDEISGAAIQLNNKDMPFNSHSLAVAVLLHFLRRKDLMPRLAMAQMGARLAVAMWCHEGKVNQILAESFENVIYKDYQPVVVSNNK